MLEEHLAQLAAGSVISVTMSQLKCIMSELHHHQLFIHARSGTRYTISARELP